MSKSSENIWLAVIVPIITTFIGAYGAIYVAKVNVSNEVEKVLASIDTNVQTHGYQVLTSGESNISKEQNLRRIFRLAEYYTRGRRDSMLTTLQEEEIKNGVRNIMYGKGVEDEFTFHGQIINAQTKKAVANAIISAISNDQYQLIKEQILSNPATGRFVMRLPLESQVDEIFIQVEKNGFKTEKRSFPQSSDVIQRIGEIHLTPNN